MACKSCQKKMRRMSRRQNQHEVGAFDTSAIPVRAIAMGAAGALVAKLADNPLKMIPVAAFQNNAVIRDATKLGLGVVMTMQQNEDVVNAGVGMAAYAATRVLGSFLPANLQDNAAGASVAGIWRNGYSGSRPEFIAGSYDQMDLEMMDDVSGLYRPGQVGSDPNFIAGNLEID